MEDRTVNLRLSDFEKEGLYLLFPDSTKLELTRENIEKVTESYWRDLTKYPRIKEKPLSSKNAIFARTEMKKTFVIRSDPCFHSWISSINMYLMTKS